MIARTFFREIIETTTLSSAFEDGKRTGKEQRIKDK